MLTVVRDPSDRDQTDQTRSGSSLIDEIVREGARRMLAQALQAEVDAYILYMVVITRMGHDTDTRAYVQRRTAEGLSKKEIIRCLKRYVARELYKILTTPRTRNQDLPAAA